MTKVDTDKVLICYLYGGTEGRMQILTTTGNTITLYTHNLFTNNAYTDGSIDLINTSYAIICYNDTDDVSSYAQIVEIIGNDVFDGMSYEVEYNNGNATSKNKVIVLDSTRAIVFYRDTDTYGKYQFLDFSGQEITTVGTEFSFDITNAVNYISVKKINSTKLLIAYTLNNLALIRIANITSFGVHFRERVYIEDSPSETATYLSLDEIINDELYMLAFALGATNKYGTSRLITISGNDILLDNIHTFTTSKTTYNQLVAFDSNNAICFYTNDLNKFTFNITFDNFVEDTSSKIDFKQIWNNDYTVFLADFENSLEAGNVDSTITGWRVKRKAEDGNFFQTLATYDDTTVTQHIDYLPRNNINYTYSVYALTNNGESLGLEEIDSVDFYGWILTNGIVSYKFDMGWNGIETNNIVSNKNMYIFENYTKYPVTSFGQQNYKTSSIKTIPYSLTTDISEISLCYEINETVRSEIESFINDGEEKWLKNTAGEIFKVVTSNFNYKYLDQVSEQPHEISFDWIEVGVGEEL